jgi:drug/metabolite transporter (DMT)-like permease
MAQQRRALLLLLVPIALFGLTWPVTKVGLANNSPLWFATGRAVLSMLSAFLLVGLLRQFRWPTWADLPIILSIGILQLAAYFALTSAALAFLPAGRSGVLASTTTLWLVPLALLGGEAIPPLRWAGVGFGLAGIATLANPWMLDWRDSGVAIGHGFLLLAALAWALAIFHTRRHRWHLLPIQVLPWQMLVATIALVSLAWLIEPRGHLTPDALTIGSLFFIGVLANPIGSWAALVASRDLPTVVSSVGFLGIPALGLLVSTSVLGEAWTWSLGLGAALIAAGVVLTTLARSPPSAPR